jgi:type I restriction enzyme, R subunit
VVYTGPEAEARQTIDRLLEAAGWAVQDRQEINLGASLGVAVREFPMADGGEADYLLFVSRLAAGVIEAKKAGVTLSGVAEQSGDYITKLPDDIPHVQLPLPFVYESTGVETFFRDVRDPQPRSRRVFAFHRPETLARWLAEADTLRQRLQSMPPLVTTGLYGCQVEAITNLEKSFASDRLRALVQMATGSGKTFTAVNFVYRLIQFAKARRVVFLVDRSNLGRQTLGTWKLLNYRYWGNGHVPPWEVARSLDPILESGSFPGAQSDPFGVHSPKESHGRADSMPGEARGSSEHALDRVEQVPVP